MFREFPSLHIRAEAGPSGAAPLPRRAGFRAGSGQELQGFVADSKTGDSPHIGVHCCIGSAFLRGLLLGVLTPSLCIPASAAATNKHQTKLAISSRQKPLTSSISFLFVLHFLWEAPGLDD